MVTVYDVEPNKLIEAVAEKLKGEIDVPDFIYFVKSGSHVERPPDDPVKFWYTRLASVLRQAYVKGNIGVNRLRRHYGKSKNRGVKPEHHRHAGGKIIRVAMQKLEKAGYLKRADNGKGRIITGKGKQLLDNTAKEISK